MPEAVNHLRQAIKQLGQRHVGYVGQYVHYYLMGEVLLWSLAQNAERRLYPGSGSYLGRSLLLTVLMKEAASQLCDNNPDVFRTVIG